MREIIKFDNTDRSGDIELLQRRTFALQKIDQRDIIAAAQAEAAAQGESLSDTLDDWAGHMDSRNTKMGDRLSQWADEERNRKS